MDLVISFSKMSASEVQVNQCDPRNRKQKGKQKRNRKQKGEQKEKRKFHDLENWELQSQPTITNDEMEELEELEQLIVMEKKELDKKNRICSNCCLQYSGEIWVYECLCVYECFCAYECLCAILQHEIANV